MTASEIKPRWQQIYEDSLPNRLRFKRWLVLYALADYVFLQVTIHAHQPVLAVIGEFAASQLLVFLLGWLVDDGGKWRNGAGRTQLQKLDPHTQSWAFLADYVGLGPFVLVAALSFNSLPHDHWYNSWYSDWWTVPWGVATLALGGALSLGFRKGEGDNYDVLTYFAKSKLAHNGVAFTVLASILINAGLPLFIFGVWSGGSHYPIWAVAFLLVWVVGSAGDAVRGGLPDSSAWKLKPENMHPQADVRGRAIYPRIPNVPTWNEFRKLSPPEFGWTDITQSRKILLQLRKLRRRGGRHHLK